MKRGTIEVESVYTDKKYIHLAGTAGTAGTAGVKQNVNYFIKNSCFKQVNNK